MDQAERSFLEEQNQIQEQIRIARMGQPDLLTPTGVCLNERCSEDLFDYKRLFCDSKCAQEYTKYKKLACHTH